MTKQGTQFEFLYKSLVDCGVGVSNGIAVVLSLGNVFSIV